MSAARFVAEAADAARTERLLDRTLRNGYVETEERPRRDSAWTIAYVFTNALLVVGGIVAFVGRDKNFFLHSSGDYLRDPSHCAAGPALLLEDHAEPVNLSAWDVAFIFVGGLVGSVVVGLLFLQLLRKMPMAAVLLSTLSFGALLAIMGATALLADIDEAGKSVPIFHIILAAVGVVFLFVPFLMWKRLKLVSRLLSVAGDGLASNPSLPGVCILVLFVSTLCVAMQAGFLPVAMMNGKVVIDNDPASNLPCKFQTSSWVPAYMGLASLTGLWTASIGEQITIYVIGGTISQWYYAEQGASTRGATMRSLRHALSPSFGSICLAGALMALLGIARDALHCIWRRVGACCAFIFQVLLSWMSIFTKFTTIRMAVTGENFFSAGVQVKNLLERNARDSITVWWLPVFVLRVFSVVAGVAWGFLWFGITKLAHFPAPEIAGFVYGALGTTVLLFVSNIMLSIVNTVFICWVMDCEGKKITHEHIHEVFMATPLAKAGFAVEQPDGTFGYAPPMAVTESATLAHHTPGSRHVANHHGSSTIV